MIERTSIEAILERAKQEQWTAEKVVAALLRVGDTKKHEKHIHCIYSHKYPLVRRYSFRCLFVSVAKAFFFKWIGFIKSVPDQPNQQKCV